jgi:hypothetical protein
MRQICKPGAIATRIGMTGVWRGSAISEAAYLASPLGDRLVPLDHDAAVRHKRGDCANRC